MKALSQPLFASLRGYDRAQLGPDLFSGALIALLSIPISMGYAQLAGLPPVYGLYGSLVPILLFAMLSKLDGSWTGSDLSVDYSFMYR